MTFREKYMTMRLKDLAKELGVTRRTVTHRAKVMGLSKSKTWGPKDDAMLSELKKKGLSTRYISDRTGWHKSTINNKWNILKAKIL